MDEYKAAYERLLGKNTQLHAEIARLNTELTRAKVNAETERNALDQVWDEFHVEVYRMFVKPLNDPDKEQEFMDMTPHRIYR